MINVFVVTLRRNASISFFFQWLHVKFIKRLGIYLKQQKKKNQNFKIKQIIQKWIKTTYTKYMYMITNKRKPIKMLNWAENKTYKNKLEHIYNQNNTTIKKWRTNTKIKRTKEQNKLWQQLWWCNTSLIIGDNIRTWHVKNTLVVEGNGKRISYAKIKQTIKGDDT
jgi:hypothetical protein